MTSKMRPLFPVKIDYSQSFKEMLEAPGFHSIDAGITERHFPMCQGGVIEVNLELLQYGYETDGREVLADLEKRNKRVATLPEALAFAKQHPKELQDRSIGVLGAVWREAKLIRKIVILFGNNDRRELRTDWLEGVFHGYFHFLVTYKYS